MKRRQGFTLVELMVAMALIIFIMVILSEAFAAALNSFRTLKAIGDMEEKLRAAATVIRRDITADHFDGGRRVSDPLWAGEPREGFFSMDAGNAYAQEGKDPDGIESFSNIGGFLNFTVKLRGNERHQFATAKIPEGNSPLSPGSDIRTNFFDQPADAMFQDNDGVFRSAWAEVAYFLRPNGAIAGLDASGKEVKLYGLYRSQHILVPDNTEVNAWSGTAPSSGSIPSGQLSNYYEFSCYPLGGTLYFNNPTDVTSADNRVSTNPGNFNRPAWPKNMPGDANLARNWSATLLVPDVLSFDVMGKYRDRETSDRPAFWGDRAVDAKWRHLNHAVPKDTDPSNNRTSKAYPVGIQITIRMWDVKTGLTRQITVIEDL